MTSHLPVRLARRTLRALLWLWAVSVAACLAGLLGAGSLLGANRGAALAPYGAAAALVVSLALVVVPGVWFVVHTWARPDGPVPAELRRSAAGSAAAMLLAALLVWRAAAGGGAEIAPALVVAGVVALVALVVLVRVMTASGGGSTDLPAELRHWVTTVAGLIGLLVVPRALVLETGTKGAAYVAEMKADLRMLALAQEAFKADSGLYGPRERLLWSPSAMDSVVLTLAPDRKGWWAEARNSSSLSHCGIWVGARPADGLRGAKENEPKCW